MEKIVCIENSVQHMKEIMHRFRKTRLHKFISYSRLHSLIHLNWLEIDNFIRGGEIMEKIHVLLNSIDKVREFVNIAGTVDCNFDLKSGRYIIDGKSIMGIFSLDLSQPLELVGTNESDRPELVNAFQNFIYQ